MLSSRSVYCYTDRADECDEYDVVDSPSDKFVSAFSPFELHLRLRYTILTSQSHTHSYTLSNASFIFNPFNLIEL